MGLDWGVSFHDSLSLCHVSGHVCLSLWAVTAASGAKFSSGGTGSSLSENHDLGHEGMGLKGESADHAGSSGGEFALHRTTVLWAALSFASAVAVLSLASARFGFSGGLSGGHSGDFSGVLGLEFSDHLSFFLASFTLAWALFLVWAAASTAVAAAASAASASASGAEDSAFGL